MPYLKGVFENVTALSRKITCKASSAVACTPHTRTGARRRLAPLLGRALPDVMPCQRQSYAVATGIDSVMPVWNTTINCIVLCLRCVPWTVPQRQSGVTCLNHHCRTVCAVVTVDKEARGCRPCHDCMRSGKRVVQTLLLSRGRNGRAKCGTAPRSAL